MFFGKKLFFRCGDSFNNFVRQGVCTGMQRGVVNNWEMFHRSSLAEVEILVSEGPDSHETSVVSV